MHKQKKDGKYNLYAKENYGKMCPTQTEKDVEKILY
jgi:hypothetical protein